MNTRTAFARWNGASRPSGLEDGNKHTRENPPFVIAGKGGGSIKTGRFFADTKGNQGDLLTTLLACAGIATKQIEELEA